MAITIGDPSGVGPEIVLRAAADGRLDETVVAYGDVAILAHGADLLGLTLELAAIDDPSQARPGRLNVVDLGLLTAADHRPGVLDGRSGAAARAAVARATDDALAAPSPGSSRCR